MSSTKTSARTRINGATWAAIIAFSFLLHGGVVATVHWNGADFSDREPEPEEEVTVAALTSYSCELNAAAASAVRMGMCATPLGGDRDACVRTAANAHRLAYLECKREPEPVFMAMVDIDKIKPMPLLPIEPVDEVVAAQLLEEQIVKKVEEAQKKIAQRVMAGQVVEVTAPPVEIRPDNARFLSEYDSQTKKETVARGSTEEMVARPAPKELPTAPTPTELPEELTSPSEGDPAESKDNSVEKQKEGSGALAMRGVGQNDRDPERAMERGATDGSTEELTSDGMRSRRGDGDRTVKEDNLDPAGGGEGGGGQKKGTIPNLRPSEEIMARTVGGGSVDKLDGVESGDFTALNSKKWKYASFFNRMKRRVAQHWHPDKVYMRRDPTGKVYGTKDRVTVLRVSLTPAGALAKVIVAKQSGIDFLDDEAVRAFREAGPFPNPPGGLVDSEGRISFQFGFHFQIGGRRDAWRIFRYR